jgi:hypothetical protein
MLGRRVVVGGMIAGGTTVAAAAVVGHHIEKKQFQRMQGPKKAITWLLLHYPRIWAFQGNSASLLSCLIAEQYYTGFKRF